MTKVDLTLDLPDRVARDEALVEELDVAPHARLDAAARVGELEREVGSAGSRAAMSSASDLIRDQTGSTALIALRVSTTTAAWRAIKS